MVLCELVWELMGAYRYPKKSIADALGQLLVTSELEVENEEVPVCHWMPTGREQPILPTT